jgi:hypothetical protein
MTAMGSFNILCTEGYGGVPTALNSIHESHLSIIHESHPTYFLVMNGKKVDDIQSELSPKLTCLQP